MKNKMIGIQALKSLTLNLFTSKLFTSELQDELCIIQQS